MTSAIRETMRFILNGWVTELAFQLNVSQNELLDRGISATAFSGGSLEIVFPDGSRSSFEFAFYLDSFERDAIAVFTEHCGYHIYPRYGLEIKTIER